MKGKMDKVAVLATLYGAMGVRGSSAPHSAEERSRARLQKLRASVRDDDARIRKAQEKKERRMKRNRGLS